MHSQQSESSCLGWIECGRLNFYRREGIFSFFLSFRLWYRVENGKLIGSQTLSAFEIKAANVLCIVRLLYLNMLNGQCGGKEINTLEYAADRRRLFFKFYVICLNIFVYLYSVWFRMESGGKPF
jgi:hypothetical protein